MKTLGTFILLIYSLISSSQNFSGIYTSMHTSFLDNINSNNNFKENTLFNISIVYDSINIKNNYILIKDPRIPKTVLSYKINKKVEKIPPNEYTNSSYVFRDCLNTNTKQLSEIVIYYNKQNELNLMISNDKFSQAFKKLIKAKK